MTCHRWNHTDNNTPGSVRSIGKPDGGPLPMQYPYPFVEIGGLVVDSSAKGTGVGRAIEQWTIDRGLIEVRLRSGSDRHHSHLFCENPGYGNEKFRYTFSERLP